MDNKKWSIKDSKFYHVFYYSFIMGVLCHLYLTFVLSLQVKHFSKRIEYIKEFYYSGATDILLILLLNEILIITTIVSVIALLVDSKKHSSN